MKKFLFVVLALVVSAVFFLNVWQSYRYTMLLQRIEGLEQEQREILERNKRIIAGIAVLRSPARLQQLAEEELGLSRAEAEEMVRVLLKGGRNDG
ncbi:MAG: cell division protein FtsL [Spirochaetales bacterium]|nr:cell division protein FtsL [Spirochaetales bacterium]MCF7937633.1 cell division protein FtsL [Spirochaetales bacterium]